MKQLTCLLVLLHSVFSDYWTDRDVFIKEEEQKVLGASITLTAKEEILNKILMSHKMQEYTIGLQHPLKFNPARHFFEAREDIEASPVFNIIKKMPKGASLHAHDTNTISQEFFLELTYRDNVYGCQINNDLFLKFLRSPMHDMFCNWTLISDLRAKNASFDEYLKSQYFLNVKGNPRETYPDINVIWQKMYTLFEKYELFLGYKPVFQEQFYQSLLELYKDNVKYYEFRTNLPKVYDLSGRTYSKIEVVGLYEEIANRFKMDYPDFIGARLIYVRIRSDAYSGINDSDVQLIHELQQLYPNFFAGLDVCGQEDLGYSTSHFNNLVNQIPTTIKRFFHAGETNWYGGSDFNTIDAVLLNTSRIGHGFSLIKHPLVLIHIKERGIAIEVCPISNQVLMLVEDLRNHPAVSLIAWGYPVVISNDNPTFWGVTGLSYDFYEAFVGMTSKRGDLRILKQLALNSLVYSAMCDLEKRDAIEAWEKDWEVFVDSVVTVVDKLPFGEL